MKLLFLILMPFLLQISQAQEKLKLIATTSNECEIKVDIFRYMNTSQEMLLAVYKNDQKVLNLRKEIDGDKLFDSADSDSSVGLVFIEVLLKSNSRSSLSTITFTENGNITMCDLDSKKLNKHK